MCDTCGCNLTHGNRHLIAPGGKLSKIEKGADAVSVLTGLLSENDHMAAHNREHFDRHGVLALNLMASPGSGKTSLLESSLATLGKRYRIAVIEAGDERPILTLSRERIADYPDIPTATELVSGESRAAVEAIVNMLDMRRGFFGPPGMDPQAMSELRTAISAAFQDPDLIAESMTAGLPLLPSDGLSEQAKIDQITAASQNLVPILRSALDAIR